MCLSSKALIQLMAAAVADRDMAFFTFGNEHLAFEVQRMHDILSKKSVTVGTYINCSLCACINSVGLRK